MRESIGATVYAAGLGENGSRRVRESSLCSPCKPDKAAPETRLIHAAGAAFGRAAGSARAGLKGGGAEPLRGTRPRRRPRAASPPWGSSNSCRLTSVEDLGHDLFKCRPRNPGTCIQKAAWGLLDGNIANRGGVCNSIAASSAGLSGWVPSEAHFFWLFLRGD